jgi:hypothetical protein
LSPPPVCEVAVVKDEQDFQTLLLAIFGCGCLGAGIGGMFFPEVWGWFLVISLGLPAVLAGGFQAGSRWADGRVERKLKNAAAEEKQTINYARYLANEERERKLNAPAKTAAVVDYRRDQAAAYHHFMLHGFDHGFTIRALARTRDDDDAPGKCVSEEDWSVMRANLCAWGVLLGDARNTKLDRKWSRERWEAERQALPYPNNPAPKVSIYVHNSTTQHANNTLTPEISP